MGPQAQPAAWLAAAFPVLAAGGLAAGSAAQEQPRILGELRDPQGAPVAGAELSFLPEPRPAVPVIAPFLPPPPALAATSDARGRFAIPAEGPGMLLATTAHGLGALVDRVDPGRPVLVRLQPLAEVVVGTGSEPFALWPARLAEGGSRHLPPAEGRSVRLPAGRYEAWFEVHEGFGWQQLELRSGRRTELHWSADARRLLRRETVRVHPSGFPQITVLGPARASATLLGAAGRARFSVAGGQGAVLRIDEALPRHGPDPLPWPPDEPPATELRPFRLTGVPGGAPPSVWLLEREARGGFRLLGSGRIDAGGTVAVPRPEGPGERWVLVTAAGRAPAAAPLPALPAPAAGELQLQPGRMVTCTLWTASGQPASDVRVDFALGAEGPVVARAHTDALGRARLGPVAGAGTVLVEDRDHLALALELPAGADSCEHRLEPGAALLGTAVLGGEAAAGIAVTLRDPGGRLRPAERTVLTDAQGRFRFAGLPPGGRFLLFAQRIEGGATWSAQAAAVAGADDARLVLQHEDPRLVPPDRGDR